jgi:hypothetical protein
MQLLSKLMGARGHKARGKRDRIPRDQNELSFLRDRKSASGLAATALAPGLLARTGGP